MGALFPFSFEGGMWDLIVLIPDPCLSIYFSNLSDWSSSLIDWPPSLFQFPLIGFQVPLIGL